MLDDLGKEWISGYGASKIKTAYSRVTLLTGQPYRQINHMISITKQFWSSIFPTVVFDYYIKVNLVRSVKSMLSEEWCQTLKER